MDNDRADKIIKLLKRISTKLSSMERTIANGAMVEPKSVYASERNQAAFYVMEKSKKKNIPKFDDDEDEEF
jgi:hypothetical protein